ncbi:MAG: hypothetical protein ACK5Q5_11465 [Planctomycetaceae bacterium]
MNSTADHVREFNRCAEVVHGENGQTLCDMELETVGSREDCQMVINWEVYAGLELVAVACVVAYAVCASGCTAGTGGVGAPACIPGCWAVFLACLAAVYGGTLPKCWLNVCSSMPETRRDIDRGIVVSMGGDSCVGQ